MDQLTPAAPTLRSAIEQAARSLGFDAIGIADVELTEDERHLEHWLARGWHGSMNYMARHGRLRTRPVPTETTFRRSTPVGHSTR